jgi:hypothetical protein
MRIEENIIVSITSWHKRIGNVKTVLETIFNQTLQPNKILLNLCTEDFPRMMQDLPEDLIVFIEDHKDIVEVYWFIENYKAWKKHLHALDIATDNDLIICIDDDHLYPEYFIENLYVSYVFYGKKYPVTTNKILICHNMWCVNGPGTLYRKSDWGDYQKYLTNDVLHNCMEDTFIGLIFAANDVMVLPEIFHLPKDEEMIYNDIFPFTDPHLCHYTPEEYQEMNNLSHVAIMDSLDKNYYNDVQNTTGLYPNIWDLAYSKTMQFEQTLQPQFPSMQYIFDLMHDSMKTGAFMGNHDQIDLEKLNIDVNRLYKKEDLIGANNKVIITISSWPARINNVATVLKQILFNTISPDLIILNLARPDFNISLGYNPTMLELSHILPEALFALMIKYPEIQIHWYDDSTLKSWKKHLYVMNEFGDNDVIICIDDDIIYSQVFIETMLKSYNLYGRNFPVTGCTCSFVEGAYAFHGVHTLYTPGFYRGVSKYLNTSIIHKFPEDNYMGMLLSLLGHLMLPVVGRNYLILNSSFNESEANYGNGIFSNNFFNDINKVMEEANNIISTNCRYRPELNYNWTPLIYNFSYEVTKQFLEKYTQDSFRYPFNLIYDEIKSHFENNFGCYDCNLKSYEIIDNYIL